MKKIYRLIIAALLLMPFVSQTMEQCKRKRDEESEHITNKKTKVDLEDSSDEITQWNDCPHEIKMLVLWFALNVNEAIEESIKAKSIKPISGVFRQRTLLKLTSKEMNDLVSDKQVFNLERINESLSENFPDLFLKLVRKAAKCKEMFQSLSMIVLPKKIINSLFILASINNHIYFCEKLIAEDIFKEKYKDNLPLIHAIYLRDHDAVKECIANGETSASLQNGANQIIMAAETGDIETLNLLLDARIDDIDGRDNEGDTALMLAALRDYNEVAKLLLDRGANINGNNNKGETALIKAVRGESLEMVKFLLGKGANVRMGVFKPIAPIITHLTILMLAAERRNEEIVNLLLDECDVNEQDSMGATALMYACQARNTEIVKLLLSKNASVHIKTPGGFTALIWAANCGNKEIVELLLDEGAYINQKSDPVGYTALIMAAFNGHTEVIKLLLHRGADANAIATDGNTALTASLGRGHQECAEFLQNHLDALNK